MKELINIVDNYKQNYYKAKRVKILIPHYCGIFYYCTLLLFLQMI